MRVATHARHFHVYRIARPAVARVRATCRLRRAGPVPSAGCQRPSHTGLTRGGWPVFCRLKQLAECWRMFVSRRHTPGQANGTYDTSSSHLRFRNRVGQRCAKRGVIARIALSLGFLFPDSRSGPVACSRAERTVANARSETLSSPGAMGASALSLLPIDQAESHLFLRAM